MAGASAGVWDCHVALLLVTALGLGQRLHPKPGLSSLGYSYDCGVKGLQLRVLPQSGQTVRFKVVDEFGNQFEVNNCSACYHWVSTKPRAPAVFSAGYKGCHVLEKDGRSHLTVFTEAVLPDGRVDATRDVALICPKPGHGWTPASHPEPPVGFSLPTCASDSRAVPGVLQTHPLWSEKFRGSLSAGGCCYDNGREVPCYYGNTATVQCFRNGHFVLVVSRETALAHGIKLANIHMAYAPTSCSPAQQTGSFVVFRFPFSHCGTTVQVAGNQLIYENQLVSDIKAQTGPQGSITWDGTFRLHVCCVFNASDFLPLRASIFLPPSPAPVTQSGPLQLQLRIAKDESFRSHYEEGDYPLVRLLRQPVPVEVRLLQRTDPSLVLLLHQCWATPGANPFQQPQWLLLSDGCPFDCDSYRTQLVALDEAELSFPSRYQHFTVATFALLDPGSQRPLRGWVYFFCSVSACSPSELETCRTVCSSGLARQRRSYAPHRKAARPQNLVSSPGPVGFEDSSRQEPPPGPTGFPRNANPGPLLWVVLLLVAVALVLGVGVFVRLSRAQHRSSRKAMEGEGAQ